MDQWFEFVAELESLWQEYLKQGPGRVELERHRTLQSQWSKLLANEQAFNEANIDKSTCEDLLELAERIATRSEGLCFITGEAGLIPRRDLHEQFEDGLQRLRDALQS